MNPAPEARESPGDGPSIASPQPGAADPLPSTCARCGRRMPLAGPEGGCLGCLLDSAFDVGEEAGEPDNATDLAIAAAEAIAAPEPPVRERFGHFEIARRPDGSLHELGRGSMGVSYLARDTVLDCPVALKVIDARLSAEPDARARFLREARAAAQLRHPNVASVFHYGEDDGQCFYSMEFVEDETRSRFRTVKRARRCFYAMEFVEGETLEARVRRDGPLPPALALEVAVQVARALVAADAQGIVHRDLKPSNLMVSAGDGSSGTETPVIKVIDFGLAKAVAAAVGKDGRRAADLTHGGFVGTPSFASPEQFATPRGEAGESSDRIDTRSDIYSLGVTLWYLLTGKVPFVGRTLTEIHDRQVHRPLPLGQLNHAKVPVPIVSLLRGMLAPDPAERPQTPRELAEQLRDCRARVGPAAGSSTAWRGRERTALAFGLAALLAATLALAALFIERGGRPFVTGRPPVSAASASLEKSIAVLPFENRSADKDAVFFADGVQDEILTDLAKIADLKVISRTSVMQYRDTAKRNLPEIARALGVSYVVEGSVQRAGNQVRVTAQLIDVRTNAQQWSTRYDRDLTDVFAIQSEIAQAIAGQLQARLSSPEIAAIQERPTADLAAYDLYLRAKELLNTSMTKSATKELLQAVRLLDEAVARDPKFLAAYCFLARAHDDIYWDYDDHTPARLALAEAAIAQAVRLRPDSGEVHLAQAVHLFHGRLDFDGALQKLELAQRTLPNNADIFMFRASIFKRQGRWEESVQNFERSAALNPVNTFILEQLGHTYQELRRYADQARILDRALALSPHELNLRAARAWVDVEARADLRSVAAVIPPLLDGSPETAESIQGYAINLALYTHDPALGARALAFDPKPDRYTVYFRGVFAEMGHDAAGAQTAYHQVLEELTKALVGNPNDAGILCFFGTVNADVGRRSEAIAAGERALQLVPVAKNAVRGTTNLSVLAGIYAKAGEKGKALEALAKLVEMPGGPSYGDLRLSPNWDPLRGDPAFEALVNKLAPPELRQAAAAVVVPEKSIAVLPFENLSADKDNDFFADGIQDDLLGSLARIKELKVINRSSVMGYRNTATRNLREIGQQLGVAHVLEGSVRRAPDRVLVNVALIDVRSGRQLWVERYDRTLADSLTLQGELATEIAAALHAALSPEEKARVEAKPTANADAYVLYLRARDYQTRPNVLMQDYRTAESLYGQAIALDPGFALARARLAATLAFIHENFQPTAELHDRARAEAEESLRLRPDLGEGHLARALCLYWTEKNYAAALEELKTAARLLPNAPEIDRYTGAIRRRQGQWAGAVESMRCALERDPRSTQAARELTRTECLIRDWPAAARDAQRAVALAPDNLALRLDRCSIDFWQRGDLAPLRAVLAMVPNGIDPDGVVTLGRWEVAVVARDFAAADQVIAGSGQETLVYQFGTMMSKAYFLGCTALARGETARARPLMEAACAAMETQAQKYPQDASRQARLGVLYAYLGRKAEAIRQGLLAVELLPESNDAYLGPSIAAQMALIYARTGEPDQAITLIERLLRTPGGLVPGSDTNMTQNDLRTRWQWDPLRGDPRFQALLAGPEPKIVYR